MLRLEVFAVLRCYAAYVGSYVPTFRDNLSAPSSRVKQSTPWPLKMGPLGRCEMSVSNYQHTLCKNPEERRSDVRK